MSIAGQWWRLGGILGIGFFISFIIGGIVLGGGAPTYDEPIEEIRTYWEDDGDAYLAGYYVLALGFVLGFLPFIVCLRALLGRFEGNLQLLTSVGFFAGLLFIAMGAVSTAPWAALALASAELQDESIRVLMYLEAGAWNLQAFFLGLFAAAVSVVMVRMPGAWRWLGVVGLVAGVALLIAPLRLMDFDPEGPLDVLGFLAFIVWGLWILATSILMTRTSEVPERQPAGV